MVGLCSHASNELELGVNNVQIQPQAPNVESALSYQQTTTK